MKKMLCGVMAIAAIMLFGCSKPTPEEVAKDYVKNQFAPAYGVKLNTSTLKYEIVKEDENSATVTVSGNIYYEEDIQLVKDDDKWILKSEAAQTEAVVAEPEPDHEPEAKPEAEAKTAAATGH
jgi:hypothetical protein